MDVAHPRRHMGDSDRRFSTAGGCQGTATWGGGTGGRRGAVRTAAGLEVACGSHLAGDPEAPAPSARVPSAAENHPSGDCAVAGGGRQHLTREGGSARRTRSRFSLRFRTRTRGPRRESPALAHTWPGRWPALSLPGASGTRCPETTQRGASRGPHPPFRGSQGRGPAGRALCPVPAPAPAAPRQGWQWLPVQAETSWPCCPPGRPPPAPAQGAAPASRLPRPLAEAWVLSLRSVGDGSSAIKGAAGRCGSRRLGSVSSEPSLTACVRPATCSEP